VKAILAVSQYVFSVSFMKTVSLSVSKPRSAKGNCLRNPVRTVLSSVCSRTISGVQPVTTSVRTRVCTKLPRADGPLWATRPRRIPVPDHSNLLTSVSEYCVGGRARPVAGAGDRALPESGPTPGRSSRRSSKAVCPDLGSEVEMAVPLHRLDQHWHQGFQPLAANPVRRFPEECEPIAFGFTVNPASRPTCPRPIVAPQQPHRMLAMISSDIDELIRYPRLLLAIARSIAFATAAVSSFLVAMLSRLIVAPARPSGRGAAYMRQQPIIRELLS